MDNGLKKLDNGRFWITALKTRDNVVRNRPL
jgi:hypothetical protein